MPHEPPIQYQKMIDDGIYLLSIKKPSEAIVIFNKILAEYPDDSQAFRWKSLAQERLSSNYSEKDDLISKSKKNVCIAPIFWIFVIFLAIFLLAPFLHLLLDNIVLIIYYSILGILLIGVLVEGWKVIV